MQVEEEEADEPGSQWDLVLVGGGGRIMSERCRCKMMPFTGQLPAELLQHLLVFACINPDGTLSEKPHPKGLPEYREAVVTAGCARSWRFTRLERVLYCVNRYLDIVKIDLGSADHRHVVRGIVWAISWGLELCFVRPMPAGLRIHHPSELGYMDRPLPDPHLPLTYFGFARLRHLCHANYLAFRCLCVWREIGTSRMLDGDLHRVFNIRWDALKDEYMLEQMQCVQAADEYYKVQGFGCSWW